jgi:hypothetical protein
MEWNWAGRQKKKVEELSETLTAFEISTCTKEPPHLARARVSFPNHDS